MTRPEIARVRGVSADGAVAGLQERGLIGGRPGRHTGRAVLYRTTMVFDRVFGLEDGRARCPRSRRYARRDRPDALRDRLVAVAAQRS